MLNPIDISSFFPVSGCVDMGPSALFCSGACNVVKEGSVHDIHFCISSQLIGLGVFLINTPLILNRKLEIPEGEFPTNIKELRTRRIFKFPKI